MTRPDRDHRGALIDEPAADALLLCAGRGDAEALGAFYDLTAPAVFGLLSRALPGRLLAERVTTRIYLRLWRSAPQFDPAEGSAYSLLCRTTHRELTDLG